ncbi:2-hydroxymuconate tautomerase [Herbaspirillum chlorophenolicum]|jgi:4-oxalocrotonate tautomerase|uniref:2-hydroxymuconate tautomerase n=1 Tax=Herbaspirillum chlorophenolicum TaxID=211589 RepID=UPI00067DAEE2|nr:2-hydroxymuconate tautomerase [Herbaspirillum chlorophenolicum]
MPIMQIFLMEGRSQEQKEKLIEALTLAAMTSIDAPQETVRVLLTEVPKAHFGIGGKSAEALGR